MNNTIKWIYRLAIVCLLMWLAYAVGGVDGFQRGKASVVSLYESPQPIRVLQKNLIDLGFDCGKNAPDGVLGNATLASYRKWDKDTVPFVAEYIYLKEIK